MNSNRNEKVAICPLCENDIDIEGLNVGDPLICPACGTTLRVVSTNPPRVDAV